MPALDDGRQSTVGPRHLLFGASRCLDGDVRSLPGEQRLAHPARQRRIVVYLTIEPGRQQVRVAAVALPQQRQYPFVGQNQFPCRLDELSETGGGVGGEILL